ncbi:hypothetical protein FDE98_15635 [Clostridium sporogenes]|uniref:Uncharacterized protein n=2 Tax=Clostridium TaxID=1485 RepID=A0A077K2J4_CLOBO|nr:MULTISPECIES: hypothetical protein [Clostridium]AJD29048.1 hypothetical protein T258_3972 [Clostridium botulinum Prevot_594]MBE1304090.1 hypothetical protein [Clostridium botulinum]NFI09708.1 hypothetical protein [Clostridium botulinum]NFI23454.1 hypothetical protein [Clostridium botulinum]NFL97941.1 hypothetical protein [Clostridium botulinum]
MKKENEIIINDGRVFFIDNISYIFPYEVKKKIEKWGVLEEYKNKFFTLNQINSIIANLINGQVYINGSMELNITVCWKTNKIQGYHHCLAIKNYYYELENRDNELNIKFRKISL